VFPGSEDSKLLAIAPPTPQCVGGGGGMGVDLKAPSELDFQVS
jgi:hypothetical protein